MNIIKTINIIAIITFFNTSISFAQTAKHKTQQDYQLQIAVAKASKAWKDAFNSGDAKAATAMYEEGAVMHVKPFGTFTGKAEIFTFWSDLIDKGFNDVIYANTVTKTIDQKSASIAADWSMNHAKGIITKELWVLQPDGRALLREDHFEVVQ